MSLWLLQRLAEQPRSLVHPLLAHEDDEVTG